MAVVTMSQIAVRAGVSRPTVSLILGGRGPELGITEATRNRVEETAREMGYRPNAHAREFIQGKIRRLGFLSSGDQEHVGRLLSGALAEAESRDWMIEWRRLRGDNEQQSLEKCIEHRLPGVIVLQMEKECQLSAFHKELARYETAMAVLDSNFRHPWGIRVISDDEDGARQAIEHLLELGHQRIVCISSDKSYSTAVAREKGYRAAMSAAGLRTRTINVGWDYDQASSLVREMLGKKDAPTAFFCACDPMALVVMRVARQCGFSVPERLSVVGYGNYRFAELCERSLTTVSQPFEEMGRTIVRLMIERIENHTPFDEPQEVRLPVQLIKRETTAPVRQA